MNVTVLLDKGVPVDQEVISYKLQAIWLGTLEQVPAPGQYLVIKGDCYEVTGLVWELDENTLRLVVRLMPPAGSIQRRG